MKISTHQKFRFKLFKYASAAALIALVFLVYPKQENKAPLLLESAVVMLGDLDNDGLVDIVDALILKKQLTQNKKHLQHDLNNDGKFDQNDLVWLTTNIVKLNKTGGVR